MRDLWMLLVFVSIIMSPLKISAEDTEQTAPFKAFTGKVTRNKVRLRLQPSLEGKILRELNKEDMLIVIGETDDFYIVKAPDDIKAYVFRTYVLDNLVEGKNVNVRLEPDLEAPIIGQLNHGDKIQGTISPLNSKWLEIATPESTKFYVCKEYIEKIGDPGLKAAIQKRRNEVNVLLNNTYQLSQDELKKPFQDIHLEPIVSNFNKVIAQYPEFSAQVARAKELLASTQDSYLQKKLAYLEAKAQGQLEPEKAKEAEKAQIDAVSPKAAFWIPLELEFYQKWASENNQGSLSRFYENQRQEGVVLKGMIEPYDRAIRNKPGDYLLISNTTRLPNAYLYSTQVDLDAYRGKFVTVIAAPRPNNNFAHPAYFVLTVD